ncbi:hypothetical protein DVDV_1546 [Desulfovibrio sp. DV]|nr:hypothetical protein DVDV_1546 [Desulfovibrio sp. DV]
MGEELTGTLAGLARSCGCNTRPKPKKTLFRPRAGAAWDAPARGWAYQTGLLIGTI